MKISIFLESSKWWKEKTKFESEINIAGNFKDINSLNLDKKNYSQENFLKNLSNILNKQKDNFAAIVNSTNSLFFFVDHVRSFPLFYSFINLKNELVISDSARKIKNYLNLNEINNVSLSEFISAGYVTGNDTIVKNIHQLQAGEFFFLDKKKDEIKKIRYFQYLPINLENKNSRDLIEQLHEIKKNIFQNIILGASGRPIWVPLSGGYDSRLIVTMLIYLGYKNIHTYTYGLKNNFETISAKKVADTLDVPWHFIETNKKNAIKLFLSNKRQDYWKYADGLCSYPVMNDFHTLNLLKHEKIIHNDALIINGQSGDFISGGHVPLKLMEGKADTETLIKYILNKHFSIWENFNNNKNYEKIVKKILSTLSLDNKSHLNLADLIGKYEQWEWQERQAKWVVNGQRVYEFFDFDWELPFWKPELIHFWKTVPLNLRLNQFLYKEYLSNFNYKGLFESFASETRRWPKHLYSIMKLSQISNKFFGMPSKNFEKYMSFWGHYSDQYAFFGFKFFLNNIKKATVPPQGRGTIALGILHWLKENNLEFKE